MSKLINRWASLGIAFSARASAPADPEATIIETLSQMKEDRKFLGLLLGWLREYGDLVHIQRLRSLAVAIPVEERCWLGGVARHAGKFDHRWHAIVNAVQKGWHSDPPEIVTSKLDRLVAKKNSSDQEFAAFGITIPTAKVADSKKLRLRSRVLKEHGWLRLRALFGSNWRADIAWLMLQDAEQTPYQVAKVLGCNMETAYRNWKALKEADATAILNVA